MTPVEWMSERRRAAASVGAAATGQIDQIEAYLTILKTPRGNSRSIIIAKA
jgi:hypothetical protein